VDRFNRQHAGLDSDVEDLTLIPATGKRSNIMTTMNMQITGVLPASSSQIRIGIQCEEQVIDPIVLDGTPVAFSFPVDVLTDDYGDLDVGGSFVHGRPGARFVYLVWQTANGDLIGRTKIYFSTAPGNLIERALDHGDALKASVNLIDQRGRPRFATVPAQVITWEAIPNLQPVSMTCLSAR
jgi:Family of unknown function (DUF5990)